MIRNPDELIVVSDGLWMHIQVTRVHHRHFPEVRGEGLSLGEASKHLACLLARSLDRLHGPRREAMGRALDDVRATLPSGKRSPRPQMALTSWALPWPHFPS